MKIRSLMIWMMISMILFSACQSTGAGTEKNPPKEKPTTQPATPTIQNPPSPVPSSTLPSTQPPVEVTLEPIPSEPPAPTLASVAPGEVLQSTKERLPQPTVNEADLSTFAAGNGQFAFDLYPYLQPDPVREYDKNFFYSPYSVNVALAMLYSGARGATAVQMADALHITQPVETIAPMFNYVDQQMKSYGKSDSGNGDEGFRLNIANGLWGEMDRPFLPEYLDLLAGNFGAGLRLADFTNQPEVSRQLINDWVNTETNDKIKDLIPPGMITPVTKMILANAIYFKGTWQEPFEKSWTKSDYFYLLEFRQIQTPMMLNTGTYGYAKTEEYQAVELPYQGTPISMVIIMPPREQYNPFEKSMDWEKLQTILASLQSQSLSLSMPLFHIESSFSLNKALIELGMLSAFAPNTANFSGIDGTRDLFISEVMHKTYLNVDESGTEAAAATAVGMKATAIEGKEPLPVIINNPFIFVIIDRQTNTILFIGRVVNPTTGVAGK